MKKLLFGILTLILIGLGFGNAEDIVFTFSDGNYNPDTVSILQDISPLDFVVSYNCSSDVCYFGLLGNCTFIKNNDNGVFGIDDCDSSQDISAGTYTIHSWSSAGFDFIIVNDGITSGGGSAGGDSTGTIPDIPGGNEPSATPPTPYNGNIIESVSGATVVLNDSALASGVGEPMFFWYGQLLNAAIKFFPVVIVVSMFRLIYGYLKNLGNKNSLESKKSLDNK